MKKWKILLTPTALKLLSDISDRRIREKLEPSLIAWRKTPKNRAKHFLVSFPGSVACLLLASGTVLFTK
jgi:mRNA interferase RelE/StbE